MDQLEVFVSYSHQDADWLRRLQVHLRPLVRDGAIDLWDDTRIGVGADWKAEIQQALARARIAVLLVSADFLASDFVANHELPPILEAASSHGVRVMPVVVGPCLFSKNRELSRYQAANPPGRPLSAMDRNEAESTLLKVAMAVMEELERSPRARDGRVLSADPKTALRTKILAAVSDLQSKSKPVSACVSQALALAIEIEDRELQTLCERELIGYEGQSNPHDPTAKADGAEHRVVQFYVSLGTEVNIDYFGGGRGAIDWMKSHPDFHPIKFLYPKPVAEIERDAQRSTADTLLSINMPAGALVPGTKTPSVPVFAYARSDALSDIVEGVRTRLTTRLLAVLRQ